MVNTTNNSEAVKTAPLNSVANSGNNTSDSTKLSKKARARNPFLEILRKSRNTFNKQIIRDAQMKKSAIEHVLKLSDKDANMDNIVFLGNFYDMVVNRLMDSSRFVRDCERLGIDAFSVAQHVIFDGNKKLDEVLVSGLEHAYGNEVVKMREPIFSREELKQGKICPKQEIGSNSTSEEIAA